MIKANELRIGNLLSYPKWYKNKTDKTWYVRDIYFEDNKIGLTDGQYQTITKLDYLEPIPLTEEILLKVGFVKDKDRDSYYIDIENGYNKFDLMWFGQMYLKSRYQPEQLDFQALPHVINLHQLQNLYFALTGTELDTAKIL